MDVAFVLVKTDPPQDPHGRLGAHLRADSRQWSSPPALHLRLEVTNHGRGAVELHNPYESATYLLTDAEGWPIGVAEPVRAVRVRPRPLPSSRASYLALTGIALDGEAVDGDADTATFELASGSTLAFDLAVRSVLAKYGSDTVQAPEPGEYGLGMILTLAWSEREQRHKEMLKTDDALRITLRPGPDEGPDDRAADDG